MTDWDAIRRGYPGALSSTYLDTATKGIPAPQTVERVAQLSDFLRTCPGASATEDAVQLMQATDEAREQVAALIGARPGEIALFGNTQQGLLAVLGSIGLRDGDVVVTDNLEFLGVTVPLQVLSNARGIEIRVVPHRDGSVPLDGIADALDDRTRVVLVSSVQEVNGAMLDLDALAEICRARGVLLVVDVIQHAGAAPLDVAASGVDCVAAGGHKWLGAPYGSGFLYVREEVLEQLQPELVGYLALRPPSAGWDSLLADRANPEAERYELLDTAQRLEQGGTPNSIGAAALATAIATLREIGLAEVYERVRFLAEVTIERLEAAGAVVTTPAEHAGVLSFSSGAGVEADRQLVGHLADRGVRVSQRSTAGAGGIRIGPFIFNNTEDLERLGEAVQEGLARLR